MCFETVAPTSLMGQNTSSKVGKHFLKALMQNSNTAGGRSESHLSHVEVSLALLLFLRL